MDRRRLQMARRATTPIDSKTARLKLARSNKPVVS
jgi:hypothetical protein